MKFKPCSICGAVEKWNSEHQRFENPEHDYVKHNLARPESRRMDSTELFGAVDAKMLDKLGNRREA